MLAKLKDALAKFPSGVVVVTTRDGKGNPWGFTASSFSSVSLDPALVSVCLSVDAECFATFRSCRRMAISILAAGDGELARRFATRGCDKFSGHDFIDDDWGMPTVAGAIATLSCRRDRTIRCGDHVILIGATEHVEVSDDADSMIYYRRRFLSAGAAGDAALVGA